MLLLAISSAQAFRVNCDYKFVSWPIIGNSYTCQARNLNITQPSQPITKIAGTHRVHLTDSHVRAFDVRRENCNFLPQRLKNFFPNLELLQVHNSKLQALKQDDLKPLSKLRVLQVNGNQITSLESKLFEFNLELVRVEFKHQRLRLIGYNILDSLTKLALADFQLSGCVNFYAQSGQGIDELKREIRINCQPIVELISEGKNLKERVEILEALDTSLGAKANLNAEDESSFKKIETKFLKLSQDNAKCLENVETVTKIFFALMENVEALEATLKAKLDRSSNEHCTAIEIENQQCQNDYQRIKRESSVVNIECEEVDWKAPTAANTLHSCNVKNLKVAHRDVEIKNVLNGNRMQAIDSQRVEELRMFNGEIMFLPQKLSQMFPDLKVLTVIDSELLEIHEKGLKGLKKLQSLILSHNQIQKVPKAFDDLAALTMLDLSSNKIETIADEALSPVQNLVQLKLNDNRLVDLPSNLLVSLLKLKILLLQNNQLAVIRSKLIEPLKKLEFADFTNNKCIDIEASRASTIPLIDLEIFFAENCMKKSA